jgi:hypothetical protein
MTTEPTDKIADLKSRAPGQTVCDEPGAQDGRCYGHLKAFHLAPADLVRRVPKGRRLFRCARCGALYEGEPIAHLH